MVLTRAGEGNPGLDTSGVQTRSKGRVELKVSDSEEDFDEPSKHSRSRVTGRKRRHETPPVEAVETDSGDRRVQDRVSSHIMMMVSSMWWRSVRVDDARCMKKTCICACRGDEACSAGVYWDVALGPWSH